MRTPSASDYRVERSALLLGGLALLAVSGREARRGRVSPAEADAFQRVNRLPDVVSAPLWLVAQLGSVPAVPLVGGLLAATGERERARNSVLAASGAYAIAKSLKRLVGRGRPADVLTEVRIRGHRATSSGYPSTHAAVAAALTLTGPPLVSHRVALSLLLPPLVGAGRMFKGAHLPADVGGGIACGLVAVGLLPRSG